MMWTVFAPSRWLIITLYCSYVALCDVDVADIDEVINAGLSCYKTPGLTVAVVNKGNVVLSKGYGVSDIETQQNVTSSTLFGIASLTKAFTTTLLSKVLSESDRFTISTNVYRILGRSKFNNPLRSIYATVEDLMAHRMGIPKNNFIRLDNLTRKDLLRRVKYLKNRGGFRDSFYYNDLMYGLLTLMTEELSNRTWEHAIMTDIFTPLDMNSSTFVTRADFSSPEVAKPYVIEKGRLAEASSDFIRHWGLIGGSGSVMSNANDMSKWMLFHLNDGKNSEGVQVVQKKLLQETYKPRNALSSSSINQHFSRPKTPVTMSNDGYALGWKTGYYRGLPILQHSGTTFGYRAFLSLLPDSKIGIFIAMTGTDPYYKFRGALTTFLADLFMGETPWINATNICSVTRKRRYVSNRSKHGSGDENKDDRWRNRTKLGHRLKHVTRYKNLLPLPSYSGTFRNEAYGNIVVYYETSSNRLKARYGIANWTLYPMRTHYFRAKWNGPPPRLNFTFRFLFSGNGGVYGIIPSFENDAPPIFVRVEKAGKVPLIS